MSRVYLFAMALFASTALAGCPEPPMPNTGGEAGSAGAGGSDGGLVCTSGWYDCDGDPANGCEAHIGSNPLHCGSCDVACSYPNAYPACVSGVCALDVCYQGHGDCDGDPANGCETDLTTDHENCGGCGIKCTMIMFCKSGECVTPS
jgi:hypothetical protein